MLDLVLIECPNLALESPKMYMPLANLYLTAVVQKAGYKVELLDFRDRIDELPPAKFYGFSCTTPQITIAKQLAKRARGMTIVGGAHPSLLPDDCVGHFDYIVRGEGEEAILDILAGRIASGIVQTQRIENLNSIPFPAWDSVEEPFSRTLYTGERYGKGNVSTAVITSRGCPWRCHFCGNIYHALKFRSVANIRQELIELMKRKVYHFRFVDDNFTLHPQFESLCHELKQLGIHYRCHTRSDLLTRRQAELMRGSGCEECSIGVESADPTVLGLNGKRETPIQHYVALKILKDVGLMSKVYLMSGLPGETDKSIDLTIQFMKDTKPDKWTLSTFTPYPGCAIYENPRKFGVTITNPHWENWWNFVFNVRDLNLPGREGYVHKLDGQTTEQMKARHDRLYYYLLQEEWKK